MPKFAQFDHAAPEPRRVLGWYDTDALAYPVLPASADLLQVTDEQWAARLANASAWAVTAGALVSYVTPASASGELAARIAAGITVVSTGAPALNAVYALDSVTLGQIGSVARDAASGLGLPGGAATFAYPDATGSPRVFDQTQMINLYKAQRDLLLTLNTQAAVMAQGGAPEWPAQTATIA